MPEYGDPQSVPHSAAPSIAPKNTDDILWIVVRALDMAEQDEERFRSLRVDGDAAQFAHHVRDVIAGRSPDTELLSELRKACNVTELRRLLTHGSSELYNRIFRGLTPTGLGRVRGSLDRHEDWSFRRLDAVDDLRKIVLFEIAIRGFDLVAVAGDHFVVLYPGRVMPMTASIVRQRGVQSDNRKKCLVSRGFALIRAVPIELREKRNSSITLGETTGQLVESGHAASLARHP